MTTGHKPTAPGLFLWPPKVQPQRAHLIVSLVPKANSTIMTRNTTRKGHFLWPPKGLLHAPKRASMAAWPWAWSRPRLSDLSRRAPAGHILMPRGLGTVHEREREQQGGRATRGTVH